MNSRNERGLDRRPVRDFLLAFLAFLGSSLLLFGDVDRPLVRPGSETAMLAQPAPGSASAPQQKSASARAVYDQPAALTAFEPPPIPAVVLLLATLFAGFCSFNLAVIRHLRCVSASPQRRSWRGG